MSALIQRRRFTVADYHRMGDAGILRQKDRVELIYGEIVSMSPIGNPHNAVVDRATRALFRIVGDLAIVRVQGSVVLDEYDEPQPDIVLLKPRDDFYWSRAAGPDDIILIVEMADSSLEYDRQVKVKLYAETGVPEYWIADIQGGRIFVYTDIRKKVYRTVRQIQKGEAAAPQFLPECRINVSDLLP